MILYIPKEWYQEEKKKKSTHWLTTAKNPSKN